MQYVELCNALHDTVLFKKLLWIAAWSRIISIPSTEIMWLGFKVASPCEQNELHSLVSLDSTATTKGSNIDGIVHQDA